MKRTKSLNQGLNKINIIHKAFIIVMILFIIWSITIKIFQEEINSNAVFKDAAFIFYLIDAIPFLFCFILYIKLRILGLLSNINRLITAFILLCTFLHCLYLILFTYFLIDNYKLNFIFKNEYSDDSGDCNSSKIVCKAFDIMLDVLFLLRWISGLISFIIIFLPKKLLIKRENKRLND